MKDKNKSPSMSIANWVIRHEWVLHLRLRVDFHGRIIFKRVNKIEAMFERPRVNVDTRDFKIQRRDSNENVA